MPVFDTIFINELHLAKVKAIRSEKEILTNNKIGSVNTVQTSPKPPFKEWLNYLKKEIKKNNNLTSPIVKHIFVSQYN